MTDSAPSDREGNSQTSHGESEAAAAESSEPPKPEGSSLAAESKPVSRGATRVNGPSGRPNWQAARTWLVTPETRWRILGLTLAAVGSAALFALDGTARNILSAVIVPGVLLAVFPPPWNNRRKTNIGLILGFIGALGVPSAMIATQSDRAADGGAERPMAKLPSCSDVGNSSSGVKDTSYYGAFRRAYELAGGRAALGCPRGDDASGFVHKWGEGYSQDLAGRDSYAARLMVLPPAGRVLVLQGTLNRDYTNQFDRNSAPQLGYPTLEPIACGDSKIVPLASGVWAPGAMVTSSDSETWIWLARPFWQRYEKLGGPMGRLGRPVGQSDPTDEEPVQKFEHGWLLLTHDKRTVRTDRETSGLREVLPPKRPVCPGR
jgi:hypothetical protein